MEPIQNPIYLELFPKKLSKGDLRKVAILEKCIEMIGTQGAENVSFDSIGRSLKIRRSHVAYYFKDRDDLVFSALQVCIATGQKLVVERLVGIRKPKNQLIAYIEGTFEWVRKYPNQISACIYMYYCATYSEKWFALNTQFKNAGMNRMRELIQQGSKKEKNISELDRLALECHNILAMNIIEFRSFKGKMSLAEKEKATIKSILNLLSPVF